MFKVGVLGVVNNTRMDAYCHSFGQDALAYANYFQANYNAVVYELISEHYPKNIGVWPYKHLLKAGNANIGQFDELIIHSQRSLNWCAETWAMRYGTKYPPSTAQAISLLASYTGGITYVLSDLRDDYLQFIDDLPVLAPNAENINFVHLGSKPYMYKTIELMPIGADPRWAKYRLNATAGPWDITADSDSSSLIGIDVIIAGFQFSNKRHSQLNQLLCPSMTIRGVGQTEPYFTSMTDNQLVDRYTLRQLIKGCIAMPMLLEQRQIDTGPWLTSRFCELVLWGKLPLMPAELASLYADLLGNEFVEQITCTSPEQAKLKIDNCRSKAKFYYEIFSHKQSFLKKTNAY